MNHPSRLALSQGSLTGCPEVRTLRQKTREVVECGSCWAFGANSAIESAYFQTTGDMISFAEQELLDCTYEEKSGKDGCQGGWLSKPIKYVQQSRRLASSQDRVYNRKDGVCSYSRVANSLTKARVTGYQTYKGDLGLISGLNKGIVSVVLFVGKSFRAYNNGIYQDVIGCKDERPNHAVSVVGYGNAEGRNYWRVRNSWGRLWGDDGYIRMSREVPNNCRISDHIYRPIMECTGDCNPPQFDEQQEEEEKEIEEECRNLKSEKYCEKLNDHCQKSSKYYRYMTKNCKNMCGLCEEQIVK